MKLTLATAACLMTMLINYSAFAQQERVKDAQETRGYIEITLTGNTKGWEVVKRITTTGRCFSPAVAPDKLHVAYVKETPELLVSAGNGESYGNELWIYDVATDTHKLLVRGHDADEPRDIIAGIDGLQYSLDGRMIYFMSEAFATSGSIQSVDVDTGKTAFVIGGNWVKVINRGPYAGNLYVARHVYLDGPAYGTEESNWVVDKTGKAVKRVCDVFKNMKACRAFEKKYLK